MKSSIIQVSLAITLILMSACPDQTPHASGSHATDAFGAGEAAGEAANAAFLAEGEGPERPFEGTAWRIVAYVPPGGSVTPWRHTRSVARLTATGGVLSGSDGCNAVTGRYRVDGPAITFEELGPQTELACQGSPAHHLYAFQSGKASFSGDRLVIASETNGALHLVAESGSTGAAIFSELPPGPHDAERHIDLRAALPDLDFDAVRFSLEDVHQQPSRAAPGSGVQHGDDAAVVTLSRGATVVGTFKVPRASVDLTALTGRLLSRDAGCLVLHRKGDGWLAERGYAYFAAGCDDKATRHCDQASPLPTLSQWCACDGRTVESSSSAPPPDLRYRYPGACPAD